MKKYRYIFVTLVLASTTASSAAVAAPEPSIKKVFTEQEQAAQKIPTSDPRDTYVLEHPVSMADALAIAEENAFSDVTYRHESSQLVGEYFPTSEYSVDQFLAEVRSTYGTSPQIVSLKASTSLDRLPRFSTGTTSEEHVLQTNKPNFVAPPVSDSLVDARKADAAEENRVPGVDQMRESEAAVAATTDWRPTTILADVVDEGGYMSFHKRVWWNDGTIDSSGGRPQALAHGHGLEYEINIYGPSTPGVRPACLQGYKDLPMAVNYNWSWVIFGDNIAATRPYADNNDLSDECNKNSMALGMQIPQALTLDLSGAVYIETAINANYGSSYNNVVGGLVQVVNAEACIRAGYLPAATDCMGLNPPEITGPTSRTSLGVTRGWTGPNLCWESRQYGDVPPVQDTLYCY